MIPDLAENPEAARTSPVRGTPQPILPAVPKKSTTSFATTGDGGYVPERTHESRARREEIARLNATEAAKTAPTAWELYEQSWKARIENSEKAKLDEMRERIRRDEQRLTELNARRENLKNFRTKERMVEIALSELSPAERSRVYEKLIAAGRVHDAEHAMYLAQIEVASRTSTPVEQNVTVDWRSSLLKK